MTRSFFLIRTIRSLSTTLLSIHTGTKNAHFLLLCWADAEKVNCLNNFKNHMWKSHECYYSSKHRALKFTSIANNASGITFTIFKIAAQQNLTTASFWKDTWNFQCQWKSVLLLTPFVRFLDWLFFVILNSFVLEKLK